MSFPKPPADREAIRIAGRAIAESSSTPAQEKLVDDDIWIPLGEGLLIASFSPIWNNLVDGFGIHDPGSGRDKQKRSRWDAIHPGRAFAEKVAPPKELAEDVMNAVAAQLRDQFD